MFDVVKYSDRLPKDDPFECGGSSKRYCARFGEPAVRGCWRAVWIVRFKIERQLFIALVGPSAFTSQEVLLSLGSFHA